MWIIFLYRIVNILPTNLEGTFLQFYRNWTLHTFMTWRAWGDAPWNRHSKGSLKKTRLLNSLTLLCKFSVLLIRMVRNTMVSGSGILTPEKKTLERKICWWWGIKSPTVWEGHVEKSRSYVDLTLPCLSHSIHKSFSYFDM